MVRQTGRRVTTRQKVPVYWKSENAWLRGLAHDNENHDDDDDDDDDDMMMIMMVMMIMMIMMSPGDEHDIW